MKDDKEEEVPRGFLVEAIRRLYWGLRLFRGDPNFRSAVEQGWWGGRASADPRFQKEPSKENLS